MVVYTGEASDDGTRYQVLCEECKQVVGWCSREECSGLSAREERVLCFSCEGVNADEVPGILLPNRHELIVYEPSIDKFITWLLRDAVKPIIELEIRSSVPRPVHNARGLSSSPYLPKCPQENPRGAK